MKKRKAAGHDATIHTSRLKSVFYPLFCIFRQVSSAILLLSSIGSLLVGCTESLGAGDQLQLLVDENYKTFYNIARSAIMDMPKSKAWHEAVPQVQDVTIDATIDGSSQPALYYDSGSDKKKPLLLVLHSWSANYRQQFSIPYGVWAVKNDWVFIHPDYRGAFTNPEATASEKAVRDVLDAVDYARNNANIDENRIYIAGFSGGGMMTLIMVGRYPEIWAGAVAWVPVYDLVQWYETTRRAAHDYSGHIINSCSGEPIDGTDAGRECSKRSPSSYLKGARGRKVSVYISTGINDNFVPPSHSFQAFNDLAEPADRISQEDVQFIDGHHSLPDHMTGTFSDSLFKDAGINLLWEKESGNVVIKVHDGKHEVIYNAGLLWLSKQHR
ncbi:MAG: alpha/beta hydrolase family protein [Chitinivibrionales bacterium]